MIGSKPDVERSIAWSCKTRDYDLCKVGARLLPPSGARLRVFGPSASNVRSTPSAERLIVTVRGTLELPSCRNCYMFGTAGKATVLNYMQLSGCFGKSKNWCNLTPLPTCKSRRYASDTTVTSPQSRLH